MSGSSREAAGSFSVAVDGGAIPLFVRGAGTSALIFLHGWSLDHRIWLPQLRDDALADHHRLIAIDRRGFGVATAPPDLGREPDDLIAVLDRLSIERAVLIGQSQAGRVALQFALDHHDRLAGLVLVGAPVAGFHLPASEEDVPVERYRALVAAGSIEAMRRAWEAHPMVADTPAAAAILADYDGRDLLAPPPPAGPDIARIGTIEAPALVVTGERDTQWRRSVGDAAARALPRGRRAELADAGHLCNADAPQAFNMLLADFIRSAGL